MEAGVYEAAGEAAAAGTGTAGETAAGDGTSRAVAAAREAATGGNGGEVTSSFLSSTVNVGLPTKCCKMNVKIETQTAARRPPLRHLGFTGYSTSSRSES